MGGGGGSSNNTSGTAAPPGTTTSRTTKTFSALGWIAIGWSGLLLLFASFRLLEETRIVQSTNPNHNNHNLDCGSSYHSDNNSSTVAAPATTSSNANKQILSEESSSGGAKATADTTPATAASASSAIPGSEGVDPVYVELFEEAQKRASKDSASSHLLGERGIVIGPTEGNFQRYTRTALQNGLRIRRILDQDDNASDNPRGDIKLALMTSPEHVAMLEKCPTDPSGIEEACRLYANGTVFDHVIATEDPPCQHNDNHTNLSQGSSKYWLKALGGYRLAPYRHSLFLDSDSFPCPGLEALFLLTDPKAANGGFGKHWQLPTAAPGDLAIGIDQFAAWQNRDWIPGDPVLLADSIQFAERNTGAVLFGFHRPQVSHALAHFIPLVSEHVYNHVATPQHKVVNDQCPFRMALYLFHRFQPDFVEHQIPMHASCRTYPGMKAAGTDGFLNGMYPVQRDTGKPCDLCSCTPCLVNHNARSWNVYLNDRRQMGWEEDFSWNDDGRR